MILYHAGLPSHLRNGRNVLLSFAKRNDLNPGTGRTFLDSGAYTAYRTGYEIDLEEFIEFILERSDEYDRVAGLDVIGGPEESWQNYSRMRQAGTKFIPTYHIGDDFQYLNRLLYEYDEVAIGGIAFRQATGEIEKGPVMRALTEVHRRADGVSLHGFGITNWNLLRAFPWNSVDSSTALVGARFGHILRFKGGELSQRLRPNTRGLERERSVLREYLNHCGFKHHFGVDDLFPLYPIKEAADNRIEFNCMVMDYAIKETFQ